MGLSDSVGQPAIETLKPAYCLSILPQHTVSIRYRFVLKKVGRWAILNMEPDLLHLAAVLIRDGIPGVCCISPKQTGATVKLVLHK